jgi:hypothetical protein
MTRPSEESLERPLLRFPGSRLQSQQGAFARCRYGNVACACLGEQRQEAMRQILEIEEHVAVPPMMYADPFYRITYLIKEEIRKHKWIEGEKGRALSWSEARAEWTKAHREQYEKFLVETLSFPNLVPTTPFAKEANLSTEEAVARICAALSTLPHRSQ